MDHREALDADGAEKYALGQMSEQERDRFEEHFFDCSECADEVKAAFVFLDNAQEAVRSERSAADRGRSTRPDPLPWWAGLKSFFLPIPMGAAATLALLLGGPAAYLAFHRVPELERELATAQALQPVSWHFLTVSRSERQVVRVSKSTRMMGLTLSRSYTTGHRYYRCAVRDVDGAGRALMSEVLPAPAGGDELQVLIPVSRLRPGSYLLALDGLDSPSGGVVAPDLARYAFTLEHEEEP
jgi:hypothetical protein